MDRWPTRLTGVAMWPDIPKDKISKQAYAAGFGAFAILCVCIYLADKLFTRLLDDEYSELILFIPAFVAFLVIQPVASKVEGWLTVRYCLKHGGHTFVANRNVESLRQCARCGAIDFDHWEESRAK